MFYPFRSEVGLALDEIDTNSQEDNDDKPAKKTKKRFRVTKGIATTLQTVGTLGELLETVMSAYDFMHALVNGPTPSAEMTFMKAQFKVVNSKLDKILESAEGLGSLVETGITIKDVNFVATDSLYNRLPEIMNLIQADTRRNKPSRGTQNEVEKYLRDVQTERIKTGSVFETILFLEYTPF